MNRKTTVGIVGNGVLGQAMTRGLIEHVKEVRIFDIEPRRSTHSQTEVYGSDIVFLCLPTPAGESGGCDTSALDNWFEFVTQVQWGQPHKLMPVTVIRSTVDVGFTKRAAAKLWDKQIPPRVVHNPEFLTARCAFTDFHTPSRHLVGLPALGDAQARYGIEQASLKLTQLYSERFPGVPIIQMTSAETELAKLATNSFFATKVVLFNCIEHLCEQMGLDYQKVRHGMLTDGRIAHSHTVVPGPDGKYGFGGMCLPKDVENLAQIMKDAGVSSGALLRYVLKINEGLRER